MGPKKICSTVFSVEKEAVCVAFRKHTLLVNHPWTNGQVETMNRTIKEATVKKYQYQTHEQLRSHLADFVNAYNFAKRLKTLKGLTPYEYVVKMWQNEPEAFMCQPGHFNMGLHT